MSQLSLLIGVCIVICVGLVGYLAGRRRSPQGTERLADQDGVALSINLLADQLHRLNTAQAAERASLDEQLRSLAVTNNELLATASSLAHTLNNTNARGQWGEMQLRRLVEVAGLSRGVDFIEQVTITGRDDGTIRPDMVVQLTDERTIVVDAKVPLDAAFAAARDADPQAGGERHARALSGHIDLLASKRYWQQFARNPPFVVMFLPAESLLGLALTHDPALLERAFRKNVVIATPSTLLAMLRTIALTWRDQRFAQDAAQIRDTAQQLADRLTALSGHLDKLGRNLATSVAQYNRLIGTYESRVLVSARKLADVSSSPAPTAAPGMIDQTIRPVIGEPSQHIRPD